jgi:hypothetical protein
MDGNDWRAAGRCGSFSSPEVRRDSGGDSNPPSEPGTALAGDDWWLLCKCDGPTKGCNGLAIAAAEGFLR